MDKYAVETDEPEGKTAAERNNCITCGTPLDPEANVPKCPSCGTEPFEKEEKTDE